MHCDPRGGHNQRSFNKNFFKTWSPQMAYILGLIFSDGAIEDARKSSRTCYLQLSSIDKSLIKQVKKTLSSNHNIYIQQPKIKQFQNGKKYLCAKQFILRIGSKEIYQDLINLKVTPRKSLRLIFPNIPKRYFSFFLRGYFDGDGCVHISLQKGRNIPNLKVVFTCGTYSFLQNLSKIIQEYVNISNKLIYKNGGAYRLAYNKVEGLKVLVFIYQNLNSAPYLDRKYEIFKNALAL